MNLFKKLYYKLGLISKPVNNHYLQHRNIEYILDIGANTGQYALAINKILPLAKIISFEPILSCYEELLINTQNINAVSKNYALGEFNEIKNINISAYSPSSSLLNMATLHKTEFKGTDYIKTEQINIKRLDDIFSELAIKGNYTIKIDVQGYEDKVIKGGLETLIKADSILVETCFEELYEGQLLFDGLYNLLTDNGFIYRGNYNQFYNKENGRILYADSFFINSRK